MLEKWGLYIGSATVHLDVGLFALLVLGGAALMVLLFLAGYWRGWQSCFYRHEDFYRDKKTEDSV